MKCETTDLEIETLVSRINNGDLNLQPDFQRGEIWTEQKKRKLIDSIIRGWKIPPIHVVRGGKAIDEVLDGQQRLVTIRDFMENKLSIDGNIAPFDERINEYNGLFYHDLPIEEQRKFRQYSIILVRLTEFKPEEPAELFYRLNQPTALTSAEQRNAFIGEPRNQIKELTDLFITLGANKDVIGFSNSRLAFDEVISKFCFTVELSTLKKKVTSTEISDKYRYNIPFSIESVYITGDVLKKFMICIMKPSDIKIVFNKATLFSWFVFIKSNIDITSDNLSEVMLVFEVSRNYLKGKYKSIEQKIFSKIEILQNKYPFFEILINTFNQRASMGSTDALSIIYRDIILNLFRDMIDGNHSELVNIALFTFKEKQSMNYVLEEIVTQMGWGEHF